MLTEAHFFHFLVQMFLLLVAARVLGELFRRWGQPAIVGELLAGIIIGATVLGNIVPQTHEWLFRPGPTQMGMLELVAFLGAIFLLFVAGMEVDLSVVRIQGKAALLTSVFGIVIPFALGLVFGWFLPEKFHGANSQRGVFAIFVATAMAISAVPVIARILMDLNLFRTDLGLVIMASAMSNDLIGWVIFSVVLGMMSGVGLQLGHVVQVIVLAIAFTIFSLTIGRWLVHRLLSWVQDNLPWPGGVLTLAFSLALLCASVTQGLGIHAVFGAFLAGIMLGDSPLLRERTKEIIFHVTMSLFAPIFFGSVGLHVNFLTDFNWLLVIGVLAIACIGKIGGCYAGARLGGMLPVEARCVAYGMNARGAMEIILALIALRQQIIGNEFFVALIVMAVITSIMSGPLLARAMPRDTRRINLPEFLVPGGFIRDLQARTKEQAIRELLEGLPEVEKLAGGKEQITRAVLLREQIMPTAMEHGVAVPHARIANISRPMLLFGRSIEGVDFDSPQGGLSHFIFVFLSPVDTPDANVQVLAAIAKVMQSARNRDRIYRAETYEEFREIFLDTLAEEMSAGSSGKQSGGYPGDLDNRQAPIPPAAS